MMSVKLSANVWWFSLTTLSSVIIGRYEISTGNDAKQHMIAIFLKLVTISISAAFCFVLSQTMCKRSQSLNTLKIIPTEQKPRDISLKYGVLRRNESFKWIKYGHLEYLKIQTSQSDGDHDGAYTVLRTVERYNLFQFDMHLQRLLNTIHQYLNSHSDSIQNIQIPSKILRKLLILYIREGLDEFYDDKMVKAEETRIMVYIDCVNLYQLIRENVDIEQCLKQCILFHFGSLPNLKRPISACVRIGRQIFKNQEKRAKWTVDRNKFHKDIDKELGLNEIIMTEIKKKDDDNNEYEGYLMEGLSSNFAVQSDLNLLTPSIDDGILPGTVRGFMVDVMDQMNENNEADKVCKEYGVIPNKVVYGKPLFSDILNWRGMVIMSTSRLLMPIDILYVDIDDDMLLKLVGNDQNHSIFKVAKSNDCGCKYRKIVYEQNNHLENMRAFIVDHMKSHSVYIGSVFNQ